VQQACALTLQNKWRMTWHKRRVLLRLQKNHRSLPPRLDMRDLLTLEKAQLPDRVTKQ
jgi:hypothetical protein